jgi:hypothetical protein
LPVLNPAAGVDVASEPFVAVPADRDSQPIRSFPIFTKDLHALACSGIAGSAGGHGMDQCVLDFCVSDSGSTRIRPVPGKCPLCEERSGRRTAYQTANGFNIFIRSACCAPVSGPDLICAIRSLRRRRCNLIQIEAEHVLHVKKAVTGIRYYQNLIAELVEEEPTSY